MRILWQSNAPHCNSGYGTVTKQIIKRLAPYHDIAVFAYYGLKGGVLDWNGIKVYPNDPDDWGNALFEHYYREHKADLLITLMDVWVLDQNKYKNVNWIPYFPIDHDIVPPIVTEHLTARKGAITMSKFGYETALKQGIRSVYIPHGVDTKEYYPDNEARRITRQALKADDKFVVGTVAANKGERKNFTAMLEVFAKFHKRHPDSEFIISTNPHDKTGIVDMPAYCKHLGIDKAVSFPSGTVLARGASADEMRAFYNAMDVFMLLSKGEGFGIPIIEAQACGVPVIVTDFSAMTELCGSGWLVPVEKMKFTYQKACQAEVNQDLALEALEKAYQAREDGELRVRAYEFAQQYDYDIIVKDYWLPALEQIEKNIKANNTTKGIAKISLTNFCNANCKTCLVPKIKSKKGVMSEDDYKQIVTKLADSGQIKYISLNNIGELFSTYFDTKVIEETIPYLHSKGVRVGITTNGELSKRIDGIDDYVISFNGYDKKSFEDTTGLDFHITLDNVRSLAKSQKGVQIHYLSLDGDEAHEKQFVELFKDLNVPLRISRKVENQFGLLDRPKEERIPCDYLDMLNIHWNGDVIMCAHDFEGSQVFGNILTQSLDQIRASQDYCSKVAEHQKGDYKGLCKKCNYNIKTGDKVFYV